MIGAYTYNQICGDLYARPEVKMAGLLFAPPQSQIAQEEIIPNIEYFHHRSGKHIHFFCAGYQYGNDSQKPKIFRIDSRDWYFNTPRFVQLYVEIKNNIQWRFSGKADLILLNTKFHQDNAELDFNNGLIFPLHKMKTQNAINEVGEFFEGIFEFAESYTGNDAIIDFMNPPEIGDLRLAHPNISILWNRSKYFLSANDGEGVLHSCALLLETMAKQIIGTPKVQNKPFGKIFNAYRQHSSLSTEQLDDIERIYIDRGRKHLAGHGGLDNPSITPNEARNLLENTAKYIRAEYNAYSI